MKEKLITVKEYAEQSGKTVNAVYKQLKGKEKQELLQGHVIKSKLPNQKTITYLDEEAVKVLDEASKGAPVIIEKDTRNERIDELENQVKMLQNELLESEKKRADIVEHYAKRLDEVTERLLALEDKQVKKHWWQFRK